jgi:hypothetical protein
VLPAAPQPMESADSPGDGDLLENLDGGLVAEDG